MAGYTRCAGGGYTRTAGGAAKGCDCCFIGTACPGSSPAILQFGLPLAITNFCAVPTSAGLVLTVTNQAMIPTRCTTSGRDAVGSRNVGGYKVSGLGAGGVTQIVRFTSSTLNGCPIYLYEVLFTDAAEAIIGIVSYYKFSSSNTTNAPVGTYSLLSITDAAGNACAGATADATVAVSP